MRKKLEGTLRTMKHLISRIALIVGMVFFMTVGAPILLTAHLNLLAVSAISIGISAVMFLVVLANPVQSKSVNNA